jgi:1-aminocyclopropane-1-carboxylate deaminase/D-cysteine desulfhydrase-like pyridoxal-dependent ACC family enzyme
MLTRTGEEPYVSAAGDVGRREAEVRALPKDELVPAPTPLEDAAHLAGALGLGRHLLVKRDDLTGPGMGGNKVRKLEHLLADAGRHGADTLVTVGAASSNHCRLTAVCGAATGFDVHLVLGAGAEEPEGNVLLDRLAGATLHTMETEDWGELGARLSDVTTELRDGGRTPYEIPLGGSTTIGARGYVDAWFELLDALDARGAGAAAVVHASSTGGTQAGLLAGRALTGRGPRVIGVDVAKGGEGLAGWVEQLANRTLTELGSDARVREDDVTVVEGGGAYGEVTDEVARSIAIGIRHHGLVTDPVYSGKALAALARIERDGLLPGGGPLVFLHTGGQPALFTRSVAAGVLERIDATDGA